MTVMPSEPPRPSPSRRAAVIVLGNEKGGTGKSTIAMHLIVHMLCRGLRVASIDLDGRQGSLTRYFENRRAAAEARDPDLPLPEHYVVAPRDLADAVQRAEDERQLGLLIGQLRVSHDVIVIDTPGAYTYLSRAGHSHADVLVTPMNDSFVDLDVLARVDPESLRITGLSHYARLVWEIRKDRALRQGGRGIDWIVLRNRLSTLFARNKRQMEAVLEALAKRIGFSVVAGLGERVIFRELFLAGLTLHDLDRAGMGEQLSMSHVAARQELRALVQAIGLEDLIRRVGDPMSGRG